MGRIKKAAGPKHEATLSPALSTFVTTAISLPLSRLPAHLQTFPRQWPFPRGDLYHWISLLNRFDNILELFNLEYGLNIGPQTQPFARKLLEKGAGGSSNLHGETSLEDLEAMGFLPDGDQHLVESILFFSRGLLENCGNRSLYNSSDRLGDLLNTTSLPLLSSTLHLAVRLAQRYHASRQRGTHVSQHLNSALLASHYNIDLEKVQKLANPFTKPMPPPDGVSASNQDPAATAKGKEKLHSSSTAQSNVFHASDLLSMVDGEGSTIDGATRKADHVAQTEPSVSGWENWGGVVLRYYQSPPIPIDESKAATNGVGISTGLQAPMTPTPVRRPSGLSRQSRLSISEEMPDISLITIPTKSEEMTVGGMKTFEIPYSKISSASTHQILKEALPGLPKDAHYDLLSKVRVSRALTTSLSTRRAILGVRLLAITNLAYIYPEGIFQQKILSQDSDDPRRLQLAYQLADLLHPPGNNKSGIPVGLQTLALGTLEALTKVKARASDVCAALNINVSHGVLLYVLRKAVADMAIEDVDGEGPENDEWRDALFSLLEALPASTPRTGESLVTAGLLDILIEALTLRTNKAERNHPKVLIFLNTFIYTVRDAFQTLANARGLDTISDLTAYEVRSSLARAESGDGLPLGYRNQVMDYQIPYFQQQTLRWLFKFVNHMMSHGSGNFDRLLRNLIDSPQLLSGLKTVIINAKVFGSNVWSGAINIMSSFIHNEPTSYAVIAEAGLSKGLLEALTLKPVDGPDALWEAADIRNPTAAILADDGDLEIENGNINTVSIMRFNTDTGATRKVKIERVEKQPLAQGILPATDAIVTIPQAFGAICLNNSGMELFLSSRVLDSFFEIFESPDHVKSMTSEGELASLIGSSFDELVRHHPRIRSAVISSVMIMIARVGSLCRLRAKDMGIGAKLWIEGDNGAMQVAGGTESLMGDLSPPYADLAGKAKPTSTEDVIMSDATSSNEAPVFDSALNSSVSIAKMEEIVDKEDEKLGPKVSTYINVAMKFLAGFFQNSSLCCDFVELGGLEFVLDFATMPSLQYDFNNEVASQEIARVVHMLAEQKPHLVVPSIVKRTQRAADLLESFSNHSNGSAFFSGFTTSDQSVVETNEVPNGTLLVKSLVSVHTLCNILYETFSPPIYNSRSNHTVFSQVNLADMYVTLVQSLSRLHRACVWEEILLQKTIPDSWKEATRIKGYSMGSDEANEVFGLISRDEPASDSSTIVLTGADAAPTTAETSGSSRPSTGSAMIKKLRKASVSKDEKTAQFKNVRTLRYLLSQTPSSITPFFQGLGKALIAKRRPEFYPRQNAYIVSDALAQANLEQLQFGAPKKVSCAKDRYAYWIVILTSIAQLMIEGHMDRSHPQCLTLVLQSFKNRGGLIAIKDLLEVFFEEAKFLTRTQNLADVPDVAARVTSAYGGIKIILGFYTQITTSKNIIEASQTAAINNDRDRAQAHYFSPNQFLVELRMAVLPVVRSIWDSEFVDNASPSIVKSLIEILRTVLDGDNEQGAFKREDKLPIPNKALFRTFSISPDRVTYLSDQGYDVELIREALYRCNNNQAAADEYCKARQSLSRVPRNPIPAYDQEKEKTPSPLRTPRRRDSGETRDSGDTIPDLEHPAQSDENSANLTSSTGEQENGSIDPQVEVEEADGDEGTSMSMAPPPPAPGVPAPAERENVEGMTMSIDNLLNMTEILGNDLANLANLAVARESLSSDRTPPSPPQTNGIKVKEIQDKVTADDLEDERSAVRQNLIERALDVLSIHSDVTFELADLIIAAASKATDVATMRREIGETLVQSLISFETGEDFRSAGKKIAAYANLLALVLQDREFYEATQEELKNNFAILLKFIKIFPEQTAEEPSPWVGQILLVIEKILAEDVQPKDVKWNPPSNDEKHPNSPIVEIEDPIIPMPEKTQLFESIMEILPRVGKDESLALSAIRTLVILTRNRDIASQLGEKRNMQRLFVMIKQLAGITNDRIQSSFMLLLRHVIEDAETIRQIMRTEIVRDFEPRPSRPTDTTGYVRQMYHLVLRSPEIFIEVTNEMLKVQRYDSNQRPQVLALKTQHSKEPPTVLKATISTAETSNAEENVMPEDQLSAEVHSSTAEDGKPTGNKPKNTEVKAPVVEHPDGVIHYLLCELLSYKDVEDKEQGPSVKEGSEEGTSTPPTEQDVASELVPTLSGTPAPSETSDPKKTEKPEFKAEQHPIHAYRCFILQCLTELLLHYNRTKIEFVNFSRKADPKAITPLKPRSGVLNYLLNAVIPVGTVNSDDSIAFRKKSSTSSLAMSVIVSLCLKTNEKGYDTKGTSLEEEEEEPDLLFVRKFVLEHALKAYKDANASSEALDVKYARMLCLADLFNRMVTGTVVPNNTNLPTIKQNGLQKPLAKIMFEKNFISALTSSIADVDLNFPGSKRAVKYILRPLKQLTHIAIILSETTTMSSTPGQTDDDEISTATSVSGMDDEREETPDLFRNSTLGMFEPGREEESSSESSEGDEDMYDDEYDDGMDYEEDMERDGDEVISDEEDEIEGVGHMEGLPGDAGMDVEVVIDGEDDEPTDEDDQDDSEDMDDGDEVEVIDEITGDDENDSLAGGEDEEWQDEDEDGEAYDGEDGLEHELSPEHDHAAAVRDIVREFGPGGPALHRLEARDLARDLETGAYMDDVVHDDDEGEEDDDEDDIEEEDVIYQPEHDDDEPGMPDPPGWGWDPDDDPGMPLPRGHHHHSRRIPGPWSIYPTMDTPRGPGDRVPMFHSHRPSGAPGGNDDGINPLLQRNDRGGGVLGSTRPGRAGMSEAAASMSDWVQAMDPGLPRGTFSAESPVSFVNNIIAALGQGGGPNFAAMGNPRGALHFHIAGTGHALIPRELQAVLGLRRPPPEGIRTTRDEPIPSTLFSPASTITRWHEEARLLFGNAHQEKAQLVVNSILRVLVPPAIDEENKRLEGVRLLKETQEKQMEEQATREKAEKDEVEAEKKREEERQAAADVEAAAADIPQVEEHGGTVGDDLMEGVEATTNATNSTTLSAEATEDTSHADAAQTDIPPIPGPSESLDRVRTTIRGRELDITGMGIDLEYLEALPEDLREEVLMHQLAEQRSQAAAAGEEPTDISREFLEALPQEIREELLQQEAQDRRRRERDENRRRVAASGGAPAPRGEDIDPASFLASLDPSLRQAVLMEQDEEVLAHLPTAIAAEARALGSDRIMHHRFGELPRINHSRGHEREGQGLEAASKKPQRRQIVQMLDKAGVATLLRLMFVPQQGSSQQTLNSILHDVSQNRQNRAEVVSLLLSILQDGSADVNAVERSFTHLSLRAKQPAAQKTPQNPKKSLTGQLSSPTNAEMTPLMVIQQCLAALVFLTNFNPHIPSFFLTEHEISSGFKSKSGRKGKGKETKATKYALNALLSLLDRKLIMESSSCMEQLSNLLQSITQPLTILLRKDKEKPEESSKVTEPSATLAETSGEAPLTANITQTTEPDVGTRDTTMADATQLNPDLVAELTVAGNEVQAGDTSGSPEGYSDEAKKPTEEDKAKKPRTLTPPIVPEYNLRLVVNILAARECSAKTFRDTLSTINNLSAIPEAKEVFGNELIKQAQDLGQSILGDLDDLIPQIQRAETGTDIQGMALARFSPASSDQAKLLRVLTALDYLFDPKRNGGKTKSAVEDKSQAEEGSASKEDLLSTLYENSTFGPLWTKLSECLSTIRQRDNMLSVATILLPLIEALMVVCKNTTLKDSPLIKVAKEFSVTSPPPESGMENLFFRFTEDHRKILNDLVRNNPKLMSGTFSLLVKNPKVLEFDNKRNYFTRRLHSRTETRHPQPPLQLSVRRDQVFLDSFKSLYFKSGDEMKYGKLSIRFHGEEGVDAGGVTREWFQVLSRQMFNPDYALFIPVASDRTTFHPSKLSMVNPEHLMFFKFIGRIIGKALYEGRALDCHFSRAVYKRILGKTVSIKDMETLDLDYYKSLLWMLENDITEIITESFSVETEAFGKVEIVDLIENGRNIPVSEENKQEYVQLVIEYRLTGSVQAQLEEFLKGFHDVVPAELISIFNEQELELLISGLPDIDVDDWKSNTEYHNYSASSSQIQWFWRAVRSFDKEERAKLLQFVTGTSKVPLNGFSQLEGMNGFSRFNIHRDYGNKDRLPSSHTCFNQLDLPEYDSYEVLRQQVYTAMTAGSEYFGFA